MYESFEHTADVGIRARAADLDALFAETARGLFALMVDDLGAVEPVHEVTIDLEGTQVDFLLFDWLNELLFRFDCEGLLFGDFNVHIHETSLHATARGEPIDRARHQLAYEVKAITYHGLRVEQADGGWLAEVIVDI